MHRLICIFSIILICLPANARLRDFVNIESYTGISLGTWSAGDGNQLWSNLNCVASSNYTNAYSVPSPNNAVSPPAVHELYRFRISDTAAQPGYFMYLDDDPTNRGNAMIPVSFEHRDSQVGTGFELLADGIYDSHAHTGQFKRCNPSNDNSEVQMSILETDLASARAGAYRGRFVAQALGGSSGTMSDTRNLIMSIAVAEIVRVSELNNVALGSWSGSGDMAASETFCVYSNNDSAGYTIGMSSPNKLGDAFRLANGDTSEFVDYTLEFNDSVGGGAGTPVASTTIPGIGNNSAADCSDSGDNATISVTVPQANLAAATPDSYADTVTLLVAPL